MAKQEEKQGENISTDTSETAKSGSCVFESSHRFTHSLIPETEMKRINLLSSPPRKQQRLVTCGPPDQGALNTGSPSKFMSPLDLLISDKTKEVTEEKKKVMEKEKEVSGGVCEMRKTSRNRLLETCLC